MDYTQKPLVYKLRKFLRYVKLYGFLRTWYKVKSQYHMKKTYENLPDMPDRPDRTGKKHVALMGCGNFPYSTIARYLTKNYGRVIRGAMDIDIHRSASLFEAYGLDYYTDKADEIINDPGVDLVYIASNHATHAEYAIEALKQGKSVHIEKPHVVSEDQLVRLCREMGRSKGKVSLGFNRPHSRIGRKIKEFLDQQDGAAMFNWFVAGHEIQQDHWYFKDEEGGRVLGNLCHWTDFVYQMVPADKRYPVTIIPARSEKADCDIAVSYIFGDGSIAAITFSAKGHTFEGVREKFAAHKGDVLISMDDFKTLTIEVVEKKYNFSGFYRDHGHEASILKSYAMLRDDAPYQGEGVRYIWETGQLFLKTREALEKNAIITVDSFEKEFARIA
jgi:predicted dehydrogenase